FLESQSAARPKTHGGPARLRLPDLGLPSAIRPTADPRPKQEQPAALPRVRSSLDRPACAAASAPASPVVRRWSPGSLLRAGWPRNTGSQRRRPARCCRGFGRFWRPHPASSRHHPRIATGIPIPHRRSPPAHEKPWTLPHCCASNCTAIALQRHSHLPAPACTFFARVTVCFSINLITARRQPVE